MITVEILRKMMIFEDFIFFVSQSNYLSNNCSQAKYLDV